MFISKFVEKTLMLPCGRGEADPCKLAKALPGQLHQLVLVQHEDLAAYIPYHVVAFAGPPAMLL